MAINKGLTKIQSEYKKALINLRKRLDRAFKSGYLPEEYSWIPDKITDEYVKKHASAKEIKKIESARGEKLRTQKAKDLYREAYQNELDIGKNIPKIEVKREEIINDYLNSIYEKLDEAYNSPNLPHKLRENAEIRRMSNVTKLSNILQDAVAHYGEDEVNAFMSNPDVIQRMNNIIEKISVMYGLSEQRDADLLIVEFASILNNGPLTDSQMQDLEEYGAFDFYEDDLI